MTAPIGYPEQFGIIMRQQNAVSQASAAATSAATKAAVEGPSLGDKPTQALGPNFAEQLAKFVGGVDGTQKSAEHKAEEFAVGHQNDIHGTMIAVEQAEISLHLLANVRNRVVDLYREVMRMGS
jgi:flagellar hook-basal body complex protein FliE